MSDQLPRSVQLVKPVQTVQTKAQVLSSLYKHRQKLQDFGVERYGIFGSFGRDRNIHTLSDVDILVSFTPEKKTFDNFMHLGFFLEDLLGRTVDLVTAESLSPHIGPHILSEVEYVSTGSWVFKASDRKHHDSSDHSQHEKAATPLKISYQKQLTPIK